MRLQLDALDRHGLPGGAGGGEGDGAGGPGGAAGVQLLTRPPGCARLPVAKRCETSIAALFVTIGQIRSLVALSSKLCPRMSGLETMVHSPKCDRSCTKEPRLPISIWSGYLIRPASLVHTATVTQKQLHCESSREAARPRDDFNISHCLIWQWPRLIPSDSLHLLIRRQVYTQWHLQWNTAATVFNTAGRSAIRTIEIITRH